MSTTTSSSRPHSGIREMLAITLPMVISQACDTIMIFTDRLFLARLAPELMNAALGGGLSAFMVMTFFIGLTGYATALTAQYLGAGKKNMCAVVATQAALVSLCAYPLILLARPLACELFALMGVDPVQRAPQILFFNILIYASFLSLLRTVLAAFFSGIGRTRIVMVSSLVGMLVNVLMNYVLIFGAWGAPALGIRGSAYGTVIGSVSALIVLVVAYLGASNRREFSLRRSLRFNMPAMKQLLKFGSPAGAELCLNIVAFNVLIMAFHGCGVQAATAATIMFNWDLVSFVPLIGIEIGVTSLVGRYMGARDPDGAHRAAMAGLKIGFIYSLVLLVLFVSVPEWLVVIFRPAGTSTVFAEAMPIAVFMVRLAALYVLGDAVIVAFIGALRGAGDTLWAMMMTVGLHWLAAGAALISLRLYNMSAEQGWITVVGTFLLFSGVIYARYRHGAWRTLRIVSPEAPADLHTCTTIVEEL